MRYPSSKLVKSWKERCQANPRALALPEFEDERVRAAALELIVEGSVKEIHIPSLRRDLKDAAAHSPFIKTLDDDRGVLDPEDDTPLLQAGTLLRLGVVDAVLAGAIATTAEVIRAAITSVGVAQGIKTISGSFIMTRHHPSLSEQLYLFADCGVVIDPNVPQLLDIAKASVETWRTVIDEIEPVVAFLSFSTKGSAQHAMAEKMREAAEEFARQCPGVTSDGELQFDAAFSQEIGRRKCPSSAVPGKANIFIFPNLDAGNIAYKITQRLGEFEAFGPILQGAGKPFSDLSRGATKDDIKASAYINLLRAHGQQLLAAD